MGQRYYFPNVKNWQDALNSLDLGLQHFGFTMKLSGVMFQGMGKTVVLVLPSSELPHAAVEVVELDAEQAAALVKQTDQPEVLAGHDGQDKVWVRKLQYEVSGHTQQQVWWADHFTCQYCGRGLPEVQLTIDHFHPLDLGGVNDSSNYLTACKKCNKNKGNTPALKWCADNHLDYNLLVDYLRQRKLTRK